MGGLFNTLVAKSEKWFWKPFNIDLVSCFNVLLTIRAGVFLKVEMTLFLDRVQLPHGCIEPFQGDSLLLTTQSPGVPGICLINLQKDETLSQPVNQSLSGLEPKQLD